MAVPISKIKQGTHKPYVDFVANYRISYKKTVSPADVQDMSFKMLAFDNVNTERQGCCVLSELLIGV